MKKVPAVPVLGRQDIETHAISLLQKFQPKAYQGYAPVDVEAFFEFYLPEHYQIKTGYTNLSFLGHDVLGYTDASAKTSDVDQSLIEAQDVVTERRCRATIAHESGHCILHVPILRAFTSLSSKNSGAKLYRRTELRAFEDPEWQAWEFAMSFLMPRHLITTYHNKGYSVYDLAEYFHVNPAFVNTRLGKLGLKN